MVSNPLPDGIESSLSRRRVLATSAGLLAGGGAYATVGVAPAVAQVSVADWSINDATYAAPDGQFYSPVLDVTAEWAFEGVDNAARVMIALMADGGIVTTATAQATGPKDSDTTTLTGNVVDSRTHAEADWRVPDGGEVSEDVAVELRLEVRNSSGETLADAAASDTTTITVSDAGPTVQASVGGSGTVGFRQREGGDVQTPTE